MRILLAFALFVVPAFAAFGQIIPTPDSPAAFVEALLAAAQGRDWRWLAILAVVGAVWTGRRFGSAWFPWLATVRGGATLAILGGLVSELAPALVVGNVTVSVVVNGIINGIAAAGGWVVARRLIFGDAVPPNPAG
jgi:hypothetical protein